MRKNLVFLMSVFALLPLHAALAAATQEELNSASQIGMMAGKSAIMYDTCVGEGFIQDEGLNAEQKFENAITHMMALGDYTMSGGARPDEQNALAKAMQAGYDAVRKYTDVFSANLDDKACGRVLDGWVEMKGQLGID